MQHTFTHCIDGEEVTIKFNEYPAEPDVGFDKPYIDDVMVNGEEREDMDDVCWEYLNRE